MTNWYPSASKAQDFSKKYPGSTMKPNVVVLHSTEGTGWPGYNKGASAPNFTIRPNFNRKTVEVRQHFPANKSSRALENRPGGVETNTLNCVQIELVGTCDPATHKKWGSIQHIYMPEAPDWFIDGVSKLIEWLHQTYPSFPIKDGAPRGWGAYPGSYGSAKTRMTNKEWNMSSGILGHQHVPENSHGDPGSFPIAKLVGKTTPKPNPSPAKKAFGRHISMNVEGNDGADGTKTYAKRFPVIVADVVASGPLLVDFQEVRSGGQLRLLTELMVAKGYVRYGYHIPTKMAKFAKKGTKAIGVAESTVFKNQNRGQKEGLLVHTFENNGVRVTVGGVHLDYRVNYDMGRVRQAKEGLASTKSRAAKDKAHAIVFTGDMNSYSYVTEKAAKPAGFHDAFVDVGKNPAKRLDHTYLRGAIASKAFEKPTKSDHKMQITDIVVVIK